MIIIMSTVMAMATHMGMVMGMDTVIMVISTITPTAMQAMLVIITAVTMFSFRSVCGICCSFRLLE